MNKVENNIQPKRELGLKLRNFRNKLALAIGQKKITTGEFGEMFGGYSERQIQTYENGVVDPPSTLLFALWKRGNSIDGIFSENEISDAGRDTARELYNQSSLAMLNRMSDQEREKLLTSLQEAKHAKTEQTRSHQEKPADTNGQRKASPSAPRHSKKHSRN